MPTDCPLFSPNFPRGESVLLFRQNALKIAGFVGKNLQESTLPSVGPVLATRCTVSPHLDCAPPCYSATTRANVPPAAPALAYGKIHESGCPEGECCKPIINIDSAEPQFMSTSSPCPLDNKFSIKTLYFCKVTLKGFIGVCK